MTFRLFGFIVGTRAALGAGLGLLLAPLLGDERRRTLGLTLVTVGAATTIPALWLVKRNLKREQWRVEGVDMDRRLIGATRLPRKGDDQP